MTPIKVGYLSVSVVSVPVPVAHRGRYLGIYRGLSETIGIRADLTPAKQASTLIHELLHACFDAYALKNMKLTEEDVCGALDGPLTALFADNPTLAGVLHQAINHGRPILETPE